MLKTEGIAMRLPMITPLKLNIMLLPLAAAAAATDAAVTSLFIEQQVDRGDSIVIAKLNSRGETKRYHTLEYERLIQDAANKRAVCGCHLERLQCVCFGESCVNQGLTRRRKCVNLHVC